MKVEKPVQAPWTEIKKKLHKALRGVVKAYEVSIKNNKDPLGQLNSTKKWIETYQKIMLNKMKGIKFVETLKVAFKNQKVNIHCTKQLTV